MQISTQDYVHGGTQKDFYTEQDVDQVACPLCSHDQSDLIYRERGHLGISRCKSCGLVFTNPRLKNPEQVYWGDSEKYFEEARLIFLGKKGHHRDPNYLHDIGLIKKIKTTGKFVDVGSSMGFFLRHASKAGFDTLGVEPSPTLSKLAKEYFHLEIINTFLEKANIPLHSIDIITMTDVFEHIPNPSELLAAARNLLKTDGILFIKVPNGKFSLLKLKLARLLKKTGQYDLFDSYEHVVHYSFKSLAQMLEKNGFNVLARHIAPPIQLPVWHHYVGHYFQYPTPFGLDPKHIIIRRLFYWLAKLEFLLKFHRDSIFTQNIVIIARAKV